jgi:hypothetical protein
MNFPKNPKKVIPGVSTTMSDVKFVSGGELLKIQLLDNQLVDTFGRKSTAQHKIYHLLESS